MNEHIVKLLLHSGRGIRLVFEDQRRYKIPKGTWQRDVKYVWWEKSAIFY